MSDSSSEHSSARARIIVVSGLPGTGKTSLARELAARYRAPLIGKDCIKEPLLDVLGAVDRAASRRLSDASFEALFALAREQLRAAVSVILEGNFRPTEHAAPLAALAAGAREVAVSAPEARALLAQVLCRTSPAQRLQRLLARHADPARHPGHRDAALAEAAAAAPLEDGAGRLDLPGPCWLFEGFEAPGWPALIGSLDRFWHGA